MLEASPYVERYDAALCAGDARGAQEVVAAALTAGVPGPALHTEVLGPAMRRIGERWSAAEISVADEHLATSICQRALITVHAAMLTAGRPARSRERVLLAAVAGERHVLGLQMVGDVLEAAGFDVLNLGADTPTDGLTEFVRRHRPAVTGLSYTITLDVDTLGDALWAIHEAGVRTRVMLGGAAVPSGLEPLGYPIVPSSARVVGAVEALLRREPPPEVPAPGGHHPPFPVL